MKVLFDYQTFNYRFGGIARYHYELSKGLELSGEKSEIATLFTQSEYLLLDPRYKVFNPIGYKPFKGRFKLSLYLEELNQLYSSLRLLYGKYDLFHPTYYNPYFLKNLKTPFVVTVHDFVHEKYDPARIDDIENKKHLIQRADKIIAISENTKRDIVAYGYAPADKVEVIYHGATLTDAMPYLSNPYGDYILYVGDRTDYKNFKPFLKAAVRILKSRPTLKLICTGKPLHMEELVLIKSYGIEQQIVQVSASDLLLRSLYKHALVFVFPSLYEGFGLPILEAFSNDCACCLSDESCFPEIAQDAALYFDPTSVDDMQRQIEKLLIDTDLRKKLTTLGDKRVKDFSWQKTNEQTQALYRSVL